MKQKDVEREIVNNCFHYEKIRENLDMDIEDHAVRVVVFENDTIVIMVNGEIVRVW